MTIFERNDNFRKPWELLNQAVQKFGGNYPEPDMHTIKDLEQYAKVKKCLILNHGT